MLVGANLALVAGIVAQTRRQARTRRRSIPSLPETVSAAALPTVQINGVVWDQVIVGNRVYATGQFTQAAPGGRRAGDERDAARRTSWRTTSRPAR